MAPVAWLPVEAVMGAVIGVGLVLGNVGRRLPVKAATSVALVALVALLLGGHLPDGRPVGAAAAAGVALFGMLTVVARSYPASVVGSLLGWSVLAAALATPDTEAPLLLGAIVVVPSLVALGSRRRFELGRPSLVLITLAWTIAMSTGASGRPSALTGAVAAWAVMAGLVLGAPLARGRAVVPSAVVLALHLVLAPWMARLTGLGHEWPGPAGQVLVVWGALAVASALVRRAGRSADHRVAGGDVTGDDGPGADHGIVADATAR